MTDLSPIHNEISKAKHILDAHKLTRPAHNDLETLRNWVYQKESLQTALDILQNRLTGTWRPCPAPAHHQKVGS